MTDFEYMNDAVDALCKSLIEEPENWVFSTYTFQKQGSNIRYWDEQLCRAITETWNGGSLNKVFSVEQGHKIRDAYQVARIKQASCAQNQVLEELKKQSCTATVYKSWWEFWK